MSRHFTKAMLFFLYHGGRDDPSLGDRLRFQERHGVELDAGGTGHVFSAHRRGVLGRQRHRLGGGTSPLAGRLLDRGYAVTVLDISQAAIDRARERLGTRASGVEWIVADVTAGPDLGNFDVWHDRAVFHFLTAAADRAAYVALLTRTVTKADML